MRGERIMLVSAISLISMLFYFSTSQAYIIAPTYGGAYLSSGKIEYTHSISDPPGFAQYDHNPHDLWFTVTSETGLTGDVVLDFSWALKHVAESVGGAPASSSAKTSSRISFEVNTASQYGHSAILVRHSIDQDGTVAVGVNNVSNVETGYNSYLNNPHTVDYGIEQSGVALTVTIDDPFRLDYRLLTTLYAFNGGSSTSYLSFEYSLHAPSGPPSFTGTPFITGSAEVGQTLGLTDIGTYDAEGDTVSLSYQWKADGTTITGAISATYTVTADEKRKAITCTLTADDGNDGVTSYTTVGVEVKNSFPWSVFLPVLVSPNNASGENE